MGAVQTFFDSGAGTDDPTTPPVLCRPPVLLYNFYIATTDLLMAAQCPASFWHLFAATPVQLSWVSYAKLTCWNELCCCCPIFLHFASSCPVSPLPGCRYDKDSSGSLSQPEFTAFLADLAKSRVLDPLVSHGAGFTMTRSKTYHSEVEELRDLPMLSVLFRFCGSLTRIRFASEA